MPRASLHAVMSPGALELLLPLLRCPGCAAPLRVADAGFDCSGCATHYPAPGGLPWLAPDPTRSRAEWRQRLDAQLVELREEGARLQRALERPGVDDLARARLDSQARACAAHAARLAELLGPVLGDGGGYPRELHAALGTPVPNRQGLHNYYANLHRDWCWGEEENALGLALVREVLGRFSPQRVLVLGAGAGRLAFDLHVALEPELTVALDLNPLLAEVARRMYAGASIELHEFPIAPKDAAAQAPLRRLQAPLHGRREGLVALVGDALHAPFADGSFDLVLTPWLIDVLDVDVAVTAARVNALLRGGGRWINTGPLAFSHPDPALHCTREEVALRVAAAGFGDWQAEERRIPYMCSPASRHGRLETVLTFAVQKQSAAPARTAPATEPDWLRSSDRPVPALPEFQQAALSMRVYGYLATLVDGRRSLAELAQLVVADRLMLPQDAEPALRGFLRRLYDDSRRPWRP